MKSNIFLWVSVVSALPVVFFYFNNSMTLLLLALIIAGFILASNLKKAKWGVYLTIALAFIFSLFLLVSITTLWGNSSVFINNNTLDMGILQVLVLKSALWFAALGLYSLGVHSIYNYQKRIKPNALLVAVPFVIFAFFILSSFFGSIDFIQDYLHSI